MLSDMAEGSGHTYPEEYDSNEDDEYSENGSGSGEGKRSRSQQDLPLAVTTTHFSPPKQVQAGGVQAWRSPTRCRATLRRRSTRATRTEFPLRARPWCWPRVRHFCWPPPPPAGTKLLPFRRVSCRVSTTATNPLHSGTIPGGGADATREAPRTKVKPPVEL